MTNKIYSIADMESIVPYYANRGMSETRINKNLDKSIKSLEKVIRDNKTSMVFAPLFVDEKTNIIIDGNCRYQAIKNVAESEHDGIDLRFKVVIDDFGENIDDAVIATQGKPWNSVDYIYNFAMREIPTYVKFVKFCETEKGAHSANGRINPKYAAAAIGFSPNKLKSKDLQISDEMFLEGRIILRQAVEIRDLIKADKSGGWFEQLIRAWREINEEVDEVDYNKFIKTFKENAGTNTYPIPYGSNKWVDWHTLFASMIYKMSSKRKRVKVA